MLDKVIVCIIFVVVNLKTGSYKMASTKVITAQYIDFIADKVIDEFGGSYQTRQTLGKTWRQKIEYNQHVEDELIFNSKVFLRTLDMRDQGNLNMMYKVCYNIADYLSKYMVKKSPDLSRKIVTDRVMDAIFFESPHFVNKFQKAYKRPLSDDPNWCACNHGVVAMYNALKQREKSK